MLTQNEIILNLEILRLKSLCRIANKEISTLEDIILENDSLFKTCDEFKNALNEKNNLSYIYFLDYLTACFLIYFFFNPSPSYFFLIIIIF